jgi:hypothetical protein
MAAVLVEESQRIELALRPAAFERSEATLAIEEDARVWWKEYSARIGREFPSFGMQSCCELTRPENVRVRIWERRIWSRRGRYFFVLRQERVFPIEKLGVAEKHEEQGREIFYISAVLQPDDSVISFDFSGSGGLTVETCSPQQMKPDEHGFYYTNGQRASREVLQKLSDAPDFPGWLRKHVNEQLVWTKR